MAHLHKRLVIATTLSIAAVATAMSAPVMAQYAEKPQYRFLPTPADYKIGEMGYPGQTYGALQQVNSVFPKVEIGDALFPKVYNLFPKVE